MELAGEFFFFELWLKFHLLVGFLLFFKFGLKIGPGSCIYYYSYPYKNSLVRVRELFGKDKKCYDFLFLCDFLYSVDNT